MGKKRKLIKFPQKFGKKYAAHPLVKRVLNESETITKEDEEVTPVFIEKEVKPEIKPKKKVTKTTKRAKSRKSKLRPSKKKTTVKKD